MSPTYRLTSELDHWSVVLQDGSTVALRAHAYGEEGEEIVFVVLMAGTPNFELDLARFPKRAVREVEGGWTQPHPIHDADGEVSP